MNNNQIIFTPGPQKCKNFSKPNRTIYHRSLEACNNLKLMNQSLAKYTKNTKIISFPLSATETFDVFINSLNKENQEVTLIKTGYWSDNLKKVILKNHLNLIEYENIFDLQEKELIELFSKNKSNLFISVLNETSTGKIYDFSLISKVLKNLNKKLFLDMVSYPIYLNENDDNLLMSDFILLSCAKNFACNPGISYLGFKNVKDIEEMFSENNYLSLKEFEYFNDKGEFIHTYDPNRVWQMNENIEMLNKQKNIRNENISKIDYFKKAIKISGFELQENNSKYISNVFHIVITKPNLTSKQVVDYLAKNNIFVGGDLNEDNSIRVCISLMTTNDEIDLLVNHLKQI
ncbi:aminotransferase class V-fold PLP-dependent enzyme [Mesoplasma photuris]|uniref:aminotransferase class V-fold PLP-dependent enzyme n=1 Tax=Mesoplasma photuris TaxID=217731 RepID=UPI000A65D8B3|nr:aminotransferase class V-fold PLP-dependent enzyme [Mesoplasma photuris]